MNILKRPMFFAALFCSVAAAISIFKEIVAFGLIAIIILVLIVVIASKKYKYIAVLLAVIIFTITLSLEFVKINQIKVHSGEKIEGTFIVVSEIVDHGEYNSLKLEKSSCSCLPHRTKLLTFDYKKTNLNMGDIVDVTISLNAIEKYDKYRLSDYGDSVYATASIQKIKKTKGENWLYKTIGQIQKFVRQKITDLFGGDVAGLLVALTTGDKTLLSDKFLGNVKTTGISHVIVVSGMHLAIIMSAIYWCIDRLFYNKYIRCLLSIFFVIIIYSVCGFTMSISRAGVMFIIASLAPILNRENDSLSSILTAITVILIATPFAIVNISFLLSILSTLSIIWIVPFYYKIIIERFNISSKFIKTVLVSTLCSIFAIIFTLPVTIKIFGYVSIVAPITNLIINLPVTIGLIFNIIAVLMSALPFIGIISYPFYEVAGLCSRFIVFVVNSIAKLPITVAVLPQVAFWWSLVLVIAVIGYMYYYDFKKKRSDLNANSI